MEESGVEYKGMGWSSKILNHSCHFFPHLKTIMKYYTYLIFF